jgi:hypothetical protein
LGWSGRMRSVAARLGCGTDARDCWECEQWRQKRWRWCVSRPGEFAPAVSHGGGDRYGVGLR